jgi:predicted Zn-dependent peptidase
MSSRLFTEVRERRGLAYYIYGYNQGYTDTGTLFAQGGVDISRIDDAVATIVGEFGRIAAEPLDPDELEKARNFAKGRLVLSLEDPKGMILFALRDEVLEGRLREPEEVLTGLDAVTREDVQRVAQDIVRADRLNLALIGPFDDPGRFEKLLSLESAS